MKWDEQKMKVNVRCIKRRIDANEYAHAFWMRYWELNYAKRWIVKETPTISRHHCGSRAGRPVVSYHPVEPVETLRVGILTGSK